MIRLLLILFLSTLAAEQQLFFTPPDGWKAAEKQELPSHVQFMCVGKGQGLYPPSINIGIEPYKGTLKQYQQMMEHINSSYGDRWTNQGFLQTAAGKAHLSQVEMTNSWGEIRLLHLVLIRDRRVFVMTAAAPKNEFNTHRPLFLRAFKSVTLSKHPFEGHPKVENAYATLLSAHEEFLENQPSLTDAQVFYLEEFQSGPWKNFQEILHTNAPDKEWEDAALLHAKEILTSIYE